MATPQVFSGPRARFSINGNIVGYAAGVSGSESVEYEPVDVINLLEVREFVPVAYRATLSAQIFRVIGKSLKQQGIFPRSNDTSILTSGDLTCGLEDVLTGNIAATFQEVKCSEHTFDVAARGLVSENVSFVCIRVKDEFELPLGG